MMLFNMFAYGNVSSCDAKVLCYAYKKRGGTKMNEVFAGIANLGFPIVVSIYLLVRVEGKLDSLTNSINELAKAIAKKD